MFEEYNQLHEQGLNGMFGLGRAFDAIMVAAALVVIVLGTHAYIWGELSDAQRVRLASIAITLTGMSLLWCCKQLPRFM